MNCMKSLVTIGKNICSIKNNTNNKKQQQYNKNKNNGKILGAAAKAKIAVVAKRQLQ